MTLPIRNSIYLMLSFPILVLFSCTKKNQYLFRNSGTWEIESMQLDYLNGAGTIDSSVNTGISGFFMFYDTPTTGEEPFYLSTNGITIKGTEQHRAHFYKSNGGIITMVTSIGQTIPDRNYTISNTKKDAMTLDYTGEANNMYNNYYKKVKEHIVLKRIKF